MKEKLNIYFQINPSKLQAKMHDNCIIIFTRILLTDALRVFISKLIYENFMEKWKTDFFDNFS